MSGTLPEPVERVSAFLRESGADARIQEFPEGTHTAQDAADAVGCELGQIVKSLVFVCDGGLSWPWSPVTDEGMPTRSRAAVEASTARVAKAQEVEDATGFAPGAVPPFPLPEDTVVLMDRALFRHPLVWAGAGSAQHVLGMAPAELARVSRARPLDVSAD